MTSFSSRAPHSTSALCPYAAVAGATQGWLRDGEQVAVVKTAHGRWRTLRPFPLTTAEAAVAAHERQLAANQQVLKRDRKRQLTRVILPEGAFVVKEYRCPGPWGRFAADARGWLNSQRLAACHVPVAPCLAWLQRRDGHALLVYADLGERCLSGLRRELWPDATQVAMVAGRVMADLHQAGIFHADLKPTNFMALAGAEIALIDFDDVRFRHQLPQAWQRRNLAQFLEGVALFLPGQRERVARRFLAAYRRRRGLPRAAFRALIRIL